MNNNMTALVSCFSRAYHCRNNENWIFRDEMAEKILSAEEYKNISSNMSAGISFFKPDFRGTEEEALRFIVDNQLAPSVLGRSAFCEHSLKNAVRLGCTRYVIFGSGYDSFSLRYSSEGAYDKTRRLAKGAGEEMKAEYSYREIEKMLENCGFLIYEHLNDKEMTETYFELYNILNPEHRMHAPTGVNYCLAVKK